MSLSFALSRGLSIHVSVSVSLSFSLLLSVSVSNSVFLSRSVSLCVSFCLQLEISYRGLTDSFIVITKRINKRFFHPPHPHTHFPDTLTSPPPFPPNHTANRWTHSGSPLATLNPRRTNDGFTGCQRFSALASPPASRSTRKPTQERKTKDQREKPNPNQRSSATCPADSPTPLGPRNPNPGLPKAPVSPRPPKRRS